MRTAKNPDLDRRLENIKRSIRKKGCKFFLVTNSKNIYYLSGLAVTDSAILITPKKDFLITDPRFSECACRQKRFRVFITELKNELFSILIKLLRSCKAKKLAFETDALSYHRYEQLKIRLDDMHIRLVPLKGVVENLKAIKDAYEIRQIKMAIQILSDTLNIIKKRIKPGVTERELGVDIECLLRLNGAQKNSFDTIVASGPHSSMPHSEITNRRFKDNDVVLLDFGSVYNWYNSDLTRVFFLGKIKDKFKELYRIVKEAQARAINIIKPGIKIIEVDKAAREYISSYGYGGYFGHNLGHGIGLDVHELPLIGPKSESVLMEGMVFSVEPGIYLPGFGGIRIEDLVLVTKEGYEVLTNDIPK